MGLSKDDLDDLHYAKSLLENSSLAIKITNLIGIPIEEALKRLPKKASDIINHATKKSLNGALHFAVMTLDECHRKQSANKIHKMFVVATGAGRGAFGLLALLMELPVSTTIMLRSIADIDRSEGEQIKTPEGKLACLEVFALGGRSETDNASELAYFSIRAALARALTEATEYIAKKGLVQEGISRSRSVYSSSSYSLWNRCLRKNRGPDHTYNWRG